MPRASLAEAWKAKLDWDEWGPQMFASYFQSVRPDVRHVFSHYRLIDSAIKVVGVGSVGTRCAISLFFGQHPDDLLVLQGKEAMPSVLAPHLTTSSVDHQGQRVVLGQRVMQTASDFFLGGSKNPDGDHSYIRHFRDWKGSVDVACLDAKGLSDYGELCAWTIAKAHTRTGNRIAIAEHAGKPKKFAARLLEEAMLHASFNDVDFSILKDAINSGDLAMSNSF